MNGGKRGRRGRRGRRRQTLSVLEEPLKTNNSLPKRVALTTTGCVISMHWHRERNKKSFGVRAVQSNAFVLEKRSPRKKDEKTAYVNTVYSSLYGLGSDAFNRFLSWYTPRSSRQPSPQLVFSQVMHLTILLDVWALLQWNGRCRIPGTEPSYGTTIFISLLRKLSLGLLKFALRQSDDPIFPKANNSGCGCSTCKEYIKKHDLNNILKKHREWEKEEKEREEQRKEKEKKQKEAAQRREEREERKRKRDLMTPEEKEAEKKQKRRKGSTKARIPRVKCRGPCENEVKQNEGLICVRCQGTVCPRCHGLKGGGVAKARAAFLCHHCHEL